MLSAAFIMTSPSTSTLRRSDGGRNASSGSMRRLPGWTATASPPELISGILLAGLSAAPDSQENYRSSCRSFASASGPTWANTPSGATVNTGLSQQPEEVRYATEIRKRCPFEDSFAVCDDFRAAWLWMQSPVKDLASRSDCRPEEEGTETIEVEGVADGRMQFRLSPRRRGD